MAPYDFANILFAGPCNLRCPTCIGRQVDPTLNRSNLDEFPLRGLDRFVDLVQAHRVTEVVMTGTTTDPQLYRHEAHLLAWLRERLPPCGETESVPVRYSLHTNGQLALRKIDTFNQYDRVCISFPSFRAATYARIMGSPRVPDLAEIMRQARVPVKISCLVTVHNAGEIEEILDGCGALGIRRVVLRNLYGDTRTWQILPRLTPRGTYRHNPVYDYHGLEVTYWNFHRTSSTSLNLFSDGTISDQYLLVKARPGG